MAYLVLLWLLVGHTTFVTICNLWVADGIAATGDLTWTMMWEVWLVCLLGGPFVAYYVLWPWELRVS